MPEELRAQLSERAKTNGRSVNAEIVAILQTAMGGANVELASFAGGDILEEVLRRYGRQVNITITTAAEPDPSSPR